MLWMKKIKDWFPGSWYSLPSWSSGELENFCCLLSELATL